MSMTFKLGLSRRKEEHAPVIEAVRNGDAAKLGSLLEDLCLENDRLKAINAVLINAVISSDRKILQVLKNFGVDFNSSLENDITYQTDLPIHLLYRAPAYEGKDNLVHILADLGADVNKLDSNGRAPIHTAVIRGANPIFIRALVEHGAGVNHKDRSGNTPLFYTLHKGQGGSNADSIRLRNLQKLCPQTLLELGADANEKNATDETVLVHLIKHTFSITDLFTMLLEHGADVKIPCGKERVTALHVAAQRGCVDAMLLRLIEHGADPFAKDMSGLSPIDWLGPRRFAILLPGMIGRGVYPSDIAFAFGKDKTPRTPLSIAMAENRADAVNRILETWFLTMDDLVQRRHPGLSLMHTSLKMIAFIKVSDMLGWTSDRASKVRHLSLPVSLQESLLFK